MLKELDNSTKKVIDKFNKWLTDNANSIWGIDAEKLNALVVEWCQENRVDNEKISINELCYGYTNLLFNSYNYEYLNRKEVLTNSKFQILPTSLEKSLNILIPGHRFYPYCNGRLKPHEMTILVGGERVNITIRNIPLAELRSYHSLIDSNIAIDHLELAIQLCKNPDESKMLTERMLRIKSNL